MYQLENTVEKQLRFIFESYAKPQDLRFKHFNFICCPFRTLQAYIKVPTGQKEIERQMKYKNWKKYKARGNLLFTK